MAQRQRILVANSNKFLGNSVWSRLIPEPEFEIVGLASDVEEAAEGILALASELNINIKRTLLVVNRVVGDALPRPLQDAIQQMEVELAGIIPADPSVNEFDAWGRPLVELGQDSPAAASVWRIAEEYVG